MAGGRIPDNEFSEQFTGDMPSMDETYHRWLQPRWDKERAWWIQKQNEQDERVAGDPAKHPIAGGVS